MNKESVQVKQCTERYHVEGNHQGLRSRLRENRHGVADMNSAVVRHEGLG
jgi:hypothetical protein